MNRFAVLSNRIFLCWGVFLCLAVWSKPCPGVDRTVTTIVDTFDGVCDAHCSIRDAVSVAGNGDVVVLLDGTYMLSLTGAENFDFGTVGVHDIDIENSITVQGVDATTTIIDASGVADRVFDSNFFARCNRTRRIRLIG